MQKRTSESCFSANFKSIHVVSVFCSVKFFHSTCLKAGGSKMSLFCAILVRSCWNALLRVHFTNIGLESCTIVTFCNLQLTRVPTQRNSVFKCRTGVRMSQRSSAERVLLKTLPNFLTRGFLLCRQEMFQVLLLC